MKKKLGENRFLVLELLKALTGRELIKHALLKVENFHQYTISQMLLLMQFIRYTV